MDVLKNIVLSEDNTQAAGSVTLNTSQFANYYIMCFGTSSTPSYIQGVDNLGTEDLITLNADTTKFDVAPFKYYFDGVEYNYAGQTGISAGFAPGDDFLIVVVTPAGLELLPKDTFLQPQDFETKQEIGGMATANGSDIIIIGNSYFDVTEFDHNVQLWSKFAKQTNFIGTAGSVSESGTARQISIASGDIIDPSLNLEQIQAEIDVGMVAYHRVAGDYEIQPKVTPFVVSNTQYDDGTDLATLGNNKWASHTIARSSRTGTYYFIYSDGQYNNQGEAVDAPYSLGGFGSVIGNEVEPLAKVIIQKGSTNIDLIVDIRGQTSSVVSASTSTMQTTYDRSTVPQIVLATDQPITYRNNAGDTNEVLQSWSSNDGSTTYVEILKGNVTRLIETVTVDSTVSVDSYTTFIDAASSSITATLPDATSSTGVTLNIKRVDVSGNSVIVDTLLSQTIDGSPNFSLGSYDSLKVISNGTNWFIV